MSGSTTCSRSGPTLGAGSRWRSSIRSTRRNRRITGRRAGPATRSKASPPPTFVACTNGSSILDGPRWSSVAISVGTMSGLAERLFGSWTASAAPELLAARWRTERRRLDGRPGGPGDPPTGVGPDRDPHRTSRTAAADRGLPRGLGDERHPGRPVQLAPEHEATRGEGLHLRRRRRIRHAPRRRTVRGAGRRQHRRSPCPRSTTCSPSSTRIRDEPVTLAELAAARDFLIGVFPLRFETAGAVVGALGGLAIHGLRVDELVGYPARSRRSTSTRSRPRHEPTSGSTTPRSCWSATPTPSARRSKRPGSAGSSSSGTTPQPVRTARRCGPRAARR